jgi:hypothetical protein
MTEQRSITALITLVEISPETWEIRMDNFTGYFAPTAKELLDTRGDVDEAVQAVADELKYQFEEKNGAILQGIPFSELGIGDEFIYDKSLPDLVLMKVPEYTADGSVGYIARRNAIYTTGTGKGDAACFSQNDKVWPVDDPFAKVSS